MPTTSSKEPTKESQDTKPSVVSGDVRDPSLYILFCHHQRRCEHWWGQGAHDCWQGAHVYVGARTEVGRARTPARREACTSAGVGRTRLRGGGRARLRGGRTWSFLSSGSSAAHFQIKLSIYASNFNSRFVSMGELELFLLTWVLTPNFNTMDLV
jgi:hypothetical protein